MRQRLRLLNQYPPCAARMRERNGLPGARPEAAKLHEHGLVVIETVPAAARSVALQFLLGDAHSSETLRECRDLTTLEQPVVGERLYWAHTNREILTVAWVRPGSRRDVLQVTLPHMRGNPYRDLSARIGEMMREHLRNIPGVRMAQTMLDPTDEDVLAIARDLEFQWAADLAWVACMPRPADPPSTPLELIPYQSTERLQLLSVLERTYWDSLDCAALSEWLEPADFLAAHESRCRPAERDWYFVSVAGEIIGCLLMCWCEQDALSELLYWGLIPVARGRRVGLDLLNVALQRATGLRRLLVACVDQANQPALKSFQRAGFVEVARRQLHIRRFS